MIYHQGEDMWKSGANYDSYVGRWSRLVARQFVPWLNVSAGAQWLDIGCGTGNLSQTILDIASPHAVLGIDSSERYIEFAHKQIKDPRVTFRVGDAQEVPVKSASYDAAVSGLVLNFVPQPSQALKGDDKSCACRWNCCSICVGLRRSDAAYAILLEYCCGS
jgi:ubiquinone/menaquinone biosynthesis C-methylase UbiE